MKNVARTLSYKKLSSVEGRLNAFVNGFFHTRMLRKYAKARRIAVKN